MSIHLTTQAESPPFSVDLQDTELDRLRALLLDEDRRSVVWRTEFSDLVTSHLLEALRRAEKQNPAAMARILSPTVVSSIRREITNSKDELVDALYPITGRLVRAAVSNAVKDMVADLNKRLDALSSPALLVARVKSIITGRPITSFLMAQTANEVRFLRAFLIDRHSGVLIQSWAGEPPLLNASEPREDTLIAAMFSAISSFTSEVYAAQDGELRTIDLNGKTLAIRQSPRQMLVVEYSGNISNEAEAHIDFCFEKMVASNNDAFSLSEIPVLNIPKVVIGKKYNKTKNIFVFILILIATYAAWNFYDRWWFNKNVQSVILFTKEASPLLYPQIEADRASRTIILRGAVEMRFDPTYIITSLQERGVKVTNLTQATLHANEVDARLNGIVNSVNVLSTQLQQQYIEARELRGQFENLDNQHRRIIQEEQVKSEISMFSQETKAVLSILDDKILNLASADQALSDRAIQIIESISIRYEQRNAFANTNEANQQLTMIATLAKLFRFKLRIEGYGDLVGSSDATEKTALLRAETVRQSLIPLGIPLEDIKIISRASVPDSIGKVMRQARIVIESKAP